MPRSFVIIGAGPAGLAAAITFARAGHTAVVYERRPHVGRGYTGNLQMLTCYMDQTDAREELLQLCGANVPEFSPQTFATLYGPAGRAVHAVAARPFGYLLRRGRGSGMLDGELLAAALEAGADVRFGETFGGRPDIVATGAKGVSGVAWEWHGEVDMDDGFHARFDSRVTPGGFGYLLVADGHVALGAAITKTFSKIGASFAGTAEFFRERYPLPDEITRTISSRASVFIPRTAFDERGTIYVGEAGGFSDILFGFGIRQAIQSGSMAAEALIKGGDFDAKWRRHLEHGLANGLAFAISQRRSETPSTSHSSASRASWTLNGLPGGCIALRRRRAPFRASLASTGATPRRAHTAVDVNG